MANRRRALRVTEQREQRPKLPVPLPVEEALAAIGWHVVAVHRTGLRWTVAVARGHERAISVNTADPASAFSEALKSASSRRVV